MGTTILTFNELQALPPPLSLSRPLTKLLQHLPSKAPTFALTFHQYDFRHFRFILSRLKEGSVTIGTNCMNILSTAQCLKNSRHFVRVLSWIKLITQNYWEYWFFKQGNDFLVQTSLLPGNSCLFNRDTLFSTYYYVMIITVVFQDFFIWGYYKLGNRGIQK